MEGTIAREAQRDLFATKPRLVLVFDPEKLDRQQVLEVVKQALDIKQIEGFRACLPCAASGMDLFAFESLVLPALKQRG